MHAAVISVTPPEEQAHLFNANNDATAPSSDPLIGSKGAGGITPPYPSVTPEIRARRGLPRSTAILLVGLALLVVLGSAGFFLFTKSNQQNPSTSTSSSPTSSAQQIPYPPFGSIALDDPLNDNSNGYNWLDSGGGAGFCTFKQGAYHVSDLQQGSNHFCLPNASFTDFAYQVQMTIIKGDVGGIAFRADKVKENGYLFIIGQDGKYRLYIFTNASSTVLRSGSSNSINKGLNQTNTVAVVANGSTIDLYVNNHKIDSVTNSAYSQGLIGVTATELNNPTEVVFSNAKVWT